MLSPSSQPYRVAGRINKSAEETLRIVESSLLANGFRVQQRDAGVLECVGPGLQSTRQNPLRGANLIRCKISEGYLAIEADLEAMRLLQRFVYWFPWTLGLGLGVILGLGQGILFGYQTNSGIGLPGLQGWVWGLLSLVGGILPVSPWLIFSPMIARSIERRTRAAIDSLCLQAAG